MAVSQAYGSDGHEEWAGPGLVSKPVISGGKVSVMDVRPSGHGKCAMEAGDSNVYMLVLLIGGHFLVVPGAAVCVVRSRGGCRQRASAAARGHGNTCSLVNVPIRTTTGSSTYLVRHGGAAPQDHDVLAVASSWAACAVRATVHCCY